MQTHILTRSGICAAIFFLASVAAWAQPKIEFIGGNTYDWGKVNASPQPLMATVKIKNAGNKDLIIENVKPSCGCTTPKLESNTIKPGATTNLEIGLNVGSNTGKMQKSMTITSNDPKEGTVQFYLVADIQRPVSVVPSYMVFPMDMQIGKEYTLTVTIRNSSEQSIDFYDFTATNGLRLNLKNKVSIPAKGNTKLTATYVPTAVGKFNSQITFRTSHPDFPSLGVGAYGETKATPKSPAMNN